MNLIGNNMKLMLLLFVQCQSDYMSCEITTKNTQINKDIELAVMHVQPFGASVQMCGALV